jgi:hypothetical protein
MVKQKTFITAHEAAKEANKVARKAAEAKRIAAQSEEKAKGAANTTAPKKGK